MKILVLGAGRIGGPAALDLAAESAFEVTVVDASDAALSRVVAANTGIAVLSRDLANTDQLTALVGDFDIVLNAVPGLLGYTTLKAIVAAGKKAVDIAFLAEDPLRLEPLAKETGAKVVVGCGIAPGLSNLLVGHVDEVLDRTDRVAIYVGGLAERRPWPEDYKAVFSPRDVIELYTRPARCRENGELVIHSALSECETVELSTVGTLEAFITDGLGTLLTTIDAPNIKEKTFRYPGHRDRIVALRDAGFFSSEELEVEGGRVRPLDFSSNVLLQSWRLGEDEADFTVMRVLVEGVLDGKPTRYAYDLLDRYDHVSGVHSMARVTGYTATAVVRLLSRGEISASGIVPPETVGKSRECFDFILRELGRRGVHLEERVEILAD